MDPDELFVQGAAQNRAKVVCATCPVRTECLADALDNRVEYGVWGGMTERERRALLRKRPDVRSWRQVLEEARDAYLERTGAVLLAPEPVTDLPQPRETVAVQDAFDEQHAVIVV
jgi:WhiB family redox-sensing transcriptional regulator